MFLIHKNKPTSNLFWNQTTLVSLYMSESKELTHKSHML